MQAIYLTSQSGIGFVNPTDVNTPTRLSPTRGLYACKYLLVSGMKASRTNNTGNAWIGLTQTRQELLIPTGEEREFLAPVGQVIDLYDLWLDVENAGDGVLVYVGNCVNILASQDLTIPVTNS